MRWLVLAACSCQASGGSWTTIDGARTDLRDTVSARARAAVEHGLVPVLYLGASYTLASSNLVALRDTPPMRAALRDIAIIHIDAIDDASPYAPLAVRYRHSFHVLDDHGDPTGAALDPGTKDGPCADGDATACAAWLRPFMQHATIAP